MDVKILTQRYGVVVADAGLGFTEHVEPNDDGGASVWLMYDDPDNTIILTVNDKKLAAAILEQGFVNALTLMSNRMFLIRAIAYTLTIEDEEGRPAGATAINFHIDTWRDSYLRSWADNPDLGPVPGKGWLRFRNDERDHAAHLASPDVKNVFVYFTGLGDTVLSAGIYPGTYNPDKMAKRATATA